MSVMYSCVSISHNVYFYLSYFCLYTVGVIMSAINNVSHGNLYLEA